MKNIAIITARGGSQRIPRKNIKKFLGAPIISYPIAAALKSELFEHVIVSTDDTDIAEEAKKYGAEVPFMRSAVNSSDTASTMDVLKEVTKELERNNIDFDNICCLYPTAVFTTEEILRESCKIFAENDFNSLIPVTPFDYPIQRSLKCEKETVFWVDEQYALKRSQDLDARYHDCGQFYWMKQNVISENLTIVNDHTGFYKIDPLQVQDIDTNEDWELAEFKYTYLQDKIKKNSI